MHREVAPPSVRAVRRAPRALVLVLVGLLPLLASTAESAPASAQQVVGRLVAEGSGQAIDGAVVSLRDGAGDRRDAAFTNEDGGFVLEAAAAGPYRIRAERIGFETWTSAPIRLARDTVLRRTFRLPVRPVDLAELRVEAERTCGTPAAEGAAINRVLEEARKAHRAARISAERGLYAFTIRGYQRELGPGGDDVRSEESSTYTARSNQPFTATSRETLARDGYVGRSEDDGRIWYAPDFSVLLSDMFLDTHCFGIESEGEGDRERVGLRFEPAPDRDVPEIEGTLWVSRAGELEFLDYHYVNLDLDVETRELGGRLEFRHLPSGAWVISRWWIRVPVLSKSRAWWGGPDNYVVALTGLFETGRVITEVRTPAGELLYDLERATLVGAVRDTARNRPVAGAVVRLTEGGRADTTGVNGRFRITGLPEGRREATVHLAPDRPPAARLEVDLRTGEFTRVEVPVAGRHQPPGTGGMLVPASPPR